MFLEGLNYSLQNELFMYSMPSVSRGPVLIYGVRIGAHQDICNFILIIFMKTCVIRVFAACVIHQPGLAFQPSELKGFFFF